MNTLALKRKACKNENQPIALMTEGSIFKSILFFSVPLILGNLLQQMYNAFDSIIVGNDVGRDALAAVGSSTSLIYLLIAFSQGAAVGAGVVVSQHLGAKDKKGVHAAVHTALAIAVILGLLLTVGGILFSRPLLVWMHYERCRKFQAFAALSGGGLDCQCGFGFASDRRIQNGGYGSCHCNKYQSGRFLRIGNAVSNGRSRTVSGELERNQNSEAGCPPDYSNWSAHRISKHGHLPFQCAGSVQRECIRCGGYGGVWCLHENRRLQYPAHYQLQHGSHYLYGTELWCREI